VIKAEKEEELSVRGKALWELYTFGVNVYPE
jgi:hypothetical protein